MKSVSYAASVLCSTIASVVTSLCIGHYFWNEVVPDIVATCQAHAKKIKKCREKE